jgi:Vitamin K-dependent gamma-carboxylase
MFSWEYFFLRPAYWFGTVDARPVSLFRILFALHMLKVAGYLSVHAEKFYSDDGFLPRNVFWDIARPYRFSLLDSMGEVWMVQGFFLLWMGVLVCLLLGYRTRWMAVLNFILICTVHERNFVLLNGADLVMRVLSFWMMFIPVGEHYSIDALRRPWNIFRATRNTADLRPQVRMIYALPVRLIQIQVAIVYIFTFVLKLPGDEWKNGTALFYALQVHSLTTPFGDWLLVNAPVDFIRMGTYFALVMESGFTFFVFLPFMQPSLRAFGLMLGVMMHTGIGLMMSIQDFSAVMIISYLTFFEPSWVEYLDQKLRRRGQPLLLPMPAQNSPLWRIIALTRSSDIHLIDDLANLDARRDDWMVMGVDGTLYTGAAAWQQVATHIPLSRFWAWTLNNASLRRALWWAGTPRYGIRQVQLCEDPTPTPRYPLWVGVGRATISLPILAMMGLVIWYNLATIETDEGKPFVPYVTDTPSQILQYTSMWQSWFMFAPFPTTDDGWMVIPGKFEDGTEIDLMTGEPLSEEMTHYWFGPDMRWKKYSSEIWRMSDPDPVLRAWAGYFCRQYSSLPEGERLATLEIHYYWRWSYKPGDSENELQDSQLWRHWCYPQYEY